MRCRGLAIRDESGTPIRMLGAHNEVTDLKRAEHELRQIQAGLERAVAARTAELEEANAALHHQIAERAREQEERLALERGLLETQRLESLGLLAGGIAHDFNNLLMGVLGNADLALHDLPDESPARQRIEDLKATAGHLAELTNQLLAYSGKGRFLVKRLDLSGLVQEMQRLMQVTIPETAAVRTALAAELPPIEGDASQIRQVVLNLLTNAADAIGSRPGLIAIRTGAQDLDGRSDGAAWPGAELPPGSYVFVEVSDNGGGMDAATRDRIFDPFFTTKFTGRGLGLAAVQGIVRGHGGSIHVYSEPGQGTTIKVLFPAAARGEPSDDRERPAPPAERPTRGLVLLVDDGETVLEVVSMLLERLGWQVLKARNGVEAVQQVRDRGPEISLILLDLTMPEMDGVEAFSRIHAMHPELRVILSSGYNHQDATSHFAGRGLAGFIQKPYDLNGLEAALEAAMGQGAAGPGPAAG